MVNLIKSNESVNGWFIIDNSRDDASQDYLLKNQTVLQQISTVYGDLGRTIDDISIDNLCEFIFVF